MRRASAFWGGEQCTASRLLVMKPIARHGASLARFQMDYKALCLASSSSYGLQSTVPAPHFLFPPSIPISSFPSDSTYPLPSTFLHPSDTPHIPIPLSFPRSSFPCHSSYPLYYDPPHFPVSQSLPISPLHSHRYVSPSLNPAPFLRFSFTPQFPIPLTLPHSLPCVTPHFPMVPSLPVSLFPRHPSYLCPPSLPMLPALRPSPFCRASNNHARTGTISSTNHFPSPFAFPPSLPILPSLCPSPICQTLCPSPFCFPSVPISSHACGAPADLAIKLPDGPDSDDAPRVY
ncbi:unnamed protein product [Closterium sp. Naga37s-1]|nr:unnamed protein product [Closterium sp. Naga37s-1]